MSAQSKPDMDALTWLAGPHRAWLDTEALRSRFGTHLESGKTRELWKYTPVKGFVSGMPDRGAAARLDMVGIDQPGVRAVPFAEMLALDADQVRSLLSDRLEAANHLLADLCLLRAPGGWLIDIEGTLEQAIHIRYLSEGNAPVVVLLRQGASAELIEQTATTGSLAQLLLVEVQEGATLTHHRLALEGDAQHWALQQIRLAANANYRLHQSLLGGQRRRSEMLVILDGRGAEASLTGAYLVESGQHLDQQLTVEHRAGDTRSRQTFHGIGCGKGRSIFNGRIHIHPHAPRSDAALSNRNLALHPEAEMNSKPELEIYTDDVRCAHGATVGQLSEDSLFYLVSRGISPTEARRLLSHGFLRECLDGPLAETAAERFMMALG
jgi:Fe-S cluster assembly protein SufD